MGLTQKSKHQKTRFWHDLLHLRLLLFVIPQLAVVVQAFFFLPLIRGALNILRFADTAEHFPAKWL